MIAAGRAFVAAALLVATVASAAPVPTVAPTGAAAPAVPLDLSDRTIRKAIADSRDPMDDVTPASGAAFGSGQPRRQRVDRPFVEAEVPSCLTAEAFRHDRPVVGAFGLGGFLALPWWAHAIVTGRCRH